MINLVIILISIFRFTSLKNIKGLLHHLFKSLNIIQALNISRIYKYKKNDVFLGGLITGQFCPAFWHKIPWLGERPAIALGQPVFSKAKAPPISAAGRKLNPRTVKKCLINNLSDSSRRWRYNWKRWRVIWICWGNSPATTRRTPSPRCPGGSARRLFPQHPEDWRISKTLRA